MRGGFLNGGGAKKPAAQSKPTQPPKTEDLTHIKAKSKEDQLKFSEVQDAMSTKLLENKDEWLNQEFFTKLAQNPRLMQAFTDPRYSTIIGEFGKNPIEAMIKYGHVPEFKQIMEDFSGLMGKHFDDVADKKKKEAEEEEKKR